MIAKIKWKRLNKEVLISIHPFCVLFFLITSVFINRIGYFFICLLANIFHFCNMHFDPFTNVFQFNT